MLKLEQVAAIISEQYWEYLKATFIPPFIVSKDPLKVSYNVTVVNQNISLIEIQIYY